MWISTTQSKPEYRYLQLQIFVMDLLRVFIYAFLLHWHVLTQFGYQIENFYKNKLTAMINLHFCKYNYDLKIWRRKNLIIVLKLMSKSHLCRLELLFQVGLEFLNGFILTNHMGIYFTSASTSVSGIIFHFKKCCRTEFVLVVWILIQWYI